MSDACCSGYVGKSKAFEEPGTECGTDEQSLGEQQGVNSRNKNVDFGSLKEQFYFNGSSGVDIFSNSRDSTVHDFNGSDYIYSKNGIADLSEEKMTKDLIDGNQPEESLSTVNMKINFKGSNDVNFQTKTPKSNDKLSFLSESSQKEMNCTQSTGNSKAADSMSHVNETVYYAVHFPVETHLPEPVLEWQDCHVYTDKEDVLNVMKLNKKARFKQFKSRKEAEEFALNGCEVSSQDGSSAIADSEKVMPFKRPKTEEMIQFRKDIERGDFETVMEKIFENPKYLVSNGDTPSILQEGSRFNALHIAAKAKNAKITRLILDIITCIDFIGYLYDDNDLESCMSRSEILLDRYLNTPDKGLNETPLHLAAKHGAVEVVQVLLSYSQCQKTDVYNRFNELPKDVVCSRVNGPCEEAKAAIAAMLEDQYFVPVLRSEDNSLQPRVGEAFSLNKPLKLESDLLSPRLEIQAYAGPMSKEKADLFKKKWKTPSKSVKDSFSLRLRDAEKGLEKTGRKLASELEVPWQEYWSFLDNFVDISSEPGLQMLEYYLKNRFQETYEATGIAKVSNSSGDSNEKNFSLNELCETLELLGSNKKQSPSATPRSRRQHSGCGSTQQDNVIKRPNELVKSDGKNPLVYVERSCEVFGKRIGAVICSCIVYGNHPESLKECLETQVRHLLTLIKSYREDNRFQSVDFQLVHSRVAAIAIQTLKDITKNEKMAILSVLNEIDWSDGALSDDEDFNYNHRSCGVEWTGATTKQLHCLVKRLIIQLRDFQEDATPQLSPSARGESDCQMLWALATPCSCTWGGNIGRRNRGGLKRKQFRTDCDCDCDVSPRKILFEEEKELSSVLPDEEEDHFSTPSSGNSDSEDMEDAKEIPNTFIYPGSVPTKTDFAVLEAIEKVPLAPEKYPNIYLWRHILQLQPKTTAVEQHNVSPEQFQRRIPGFESPKSSPRKLLERSFGGFESPPLQTPRVEPWERVTGAYSPRRSTRSPFSVLHSENLLMSR